MTTQVRYGTDFLTNFGGYGRFDHSHFSLSYIHITHTQIKHFILSQLPAENHSNASRQKEITKGDQHQISCTKSV